MSKVTLERYGASLEINKITSKQAKDWLKRVKDEGDDLDLLDLRDFGKEVESTIGIFPDNKINNDDDIEVNLKDCEWNSADFEAKKNSYYAVFLYGEKGGFGEIEIDLNGKKFDPDKLLVHNTCYDNLIDLYIVDSFEYDGTQIDIDGDYCEPEQKSIQIYIIKTGEYGGFSEMIYDSTSLN